MEPLRREVLPPRSWAATRGVAWLGPLFVLGSTLALAMAMAAMALSPRPHPRHVHFDRAPAVQRPAHPRVTTESAARLRLRLEASLAEDVRARCGAPVYHARADGMVDVSYELCPITTP